MVAKLAMRDVAQLTARYVVGGSDRTGGFVRGVVEGLRGCWAGGGGGEKKPLACRWQPLRRQRRPLRAGPWLR